MNEFYEIIICVDDEKSILDGLQQQLSRAFGDRYILEFAQSGQEALDLVEELKGEGMSVPFLITDQMMPGMNGHEVIQKMAVISPLTKCILLTGYTDTHIIENLKEYNLLACLNKPWEREELIETIKSAKYPSI
jgi:YesN/AraC family two-component response regulator